jgi:hypothetical protein
VFTSYSNVFGLFGLSGSEGNVSLFLLVHGHVDLVTDELEELSEGLLVVLANLACSKLKVNLSQVHTNSSWCEFFEKLVGEIKRKTVSFSSSSGSELSCVNGVNVKGDPVLGVFIVVEVLVHLSMDAVEGISLAVLWFKDEDLLVFHELFFFLFKGSNSEIAQVFFDVDTLPMSVKWDHTRKVSKGHSVCVFGWRRGWGICVDVCINPNQFGIWIESFHSSNGTDGLRVITTQYYWIVTVFESFKSLVSQLLRGFNDVFDVLGVKFLCSCHLNTSGLGLVNMEQVTFPAGHGNLLVLNWHRSVLMSEILEPILVL